MNEESIVSRLMTAHKDSQQRCLGSNIFLEAANRIEALENAMHRIDAWAEAYPLEVFPEPDFAKAREALKYAGITIDAISASNMRHVIETVSRIANEALKESHPQ